MILILSKSEFESSTEYVIDWIDHFGSSWRRVNGIDLEEVKMSITISNETEHVKFRDVDFDPGEIKVVWYRRWHDSFPHSKIDLAEPAISFELKASLFSERKKLSQTFFDSFSHAEWLSYPLDGFTKTKALRKAVVAGLKIPQTYILNNRDDIESLLRLGNRFITKCMGDSPIFFSKDNVYLLYTKEFIMNELVTQNDFFYPTLFQERIEKEYELRIFYLNGACYSMAIFSQTNLQTVEDFRQYDQGKPNRLVPYKLPAEIENKITVLMGELSLDTGSIDMIKSKSGDYIFLEVNPVGQFGMTSRPCNFYLEKKIAEYLISKSN